MVPECVHTTSITDLILLGLRSHYNHPLPDSHTWSSLPSRFSFRKPPLMTVASTDLFHDFSNHFTSSRTPLSNLIKFSNTFLYVNFISLINTLLQQKLEAGWSCDRPLRNTCSVKLILKSIFNIGFNFLKYFQLQLTQHEWGITDK